MKKFETSRDGFILEIENVNKKSIICKRYTKTPIEILDCQEKSARIMDIITDDLKLKSSTIKINKNSSFKKDNNQLVFKMFRNDDEILGVEKINLDDFPPKVRYQINILHLMPEIMNEIIKK